MSHLPLPTPHAPDATGSPHATDRAPVEEAPMTDPVVADPDRPADPDCPTCGERPDPDDRFCEGCGTRLPEREPAAGDAAAQVGAGEVGTGGERTRTDLRAAIARPVACGTCGSASIGADGFCDDCGHVAPAGRDHVEESVAGTAALTDRGLVRSRNEDAYAVVRADGVTFAVVCDGVASVARGADASLAACEAAADAVAEAAPTALPEAGANDVDTLVEVGDTAAAAGRAAVVALHDPAAGDPPACTYVSGLVADGTVVVHWVGDSRAYWLPDPGTGDEPRTLSVDDSWAAEIVAVGLRTPEEAWADRRAHVLTRWVAADSPDRPARSTTLTPAGPGVLLLCSDGLWNHLPDADVLARLCPPPGDGAARDLPAAARALLHAVLADGAHDNTTIALVEVGAPGAAPREPAPEGGAR